MWSGKMKQLMLVAQYQEARVFILLGPPYSGRKRLARAYASWLNGAADLCFC